MKLAPQFLFIIVALPITTARSTLAAESQTSDSSPGEARARRTYEIALELYRAQYYKEAAVYLRKAYDQSRQPAFLFNLALTYRKLGNRAAARNALEQYLERESADAPSRARARYLLASLRGDPRVVAMEDDENPLA